ncbi:unnamed protein product [Discula destructiva]
MAEGSVSALQPARLPAEATTLSVAPAMSTLLTEEERRQVEECQRILQFQDRVLAGSHPRIKVPAHVIAPKQSSDTRGQASVSTTAPLGQTVSALGKLPPKGPRLSRANATMPTNGNGSQVAANLRSFGANAAHSAPAKHTTATQPPSLESLLGPGSTVNGIPTGPKADAGKLPSDSSAGAQFDPVLLTKSEGLIKAEFRAKRKRLEDALEEQLRQHRAATKAANTIEAPVDFDLAAVLMKALQLAQSSALPQTDANLAANHSGSESDSNATFYSSQHDTPESHLDQRIPGSDEAAAAQEREDSSYEPPMVMDASSIPTQAPLVTMPPSTATTNPFATAHPPLSQQLSSNPFAQPPASFANSRTHDNHPTHTSLQRGDNAFGGSNAEQEANGVPMEIISSQESGEGRSSGDSGLVAGVQASTQSRLESATRQMIEQAFGRHHSPILRAHNLSPIAPQPAHVSPLATSRQPPLPQQDAPPAQATSAQIAALRADHSNGSSPDSSPQGKAGKRGKKNKKRKADRMAANNASTPYIKPEPRSPSPMTAPQYPRHANKRMRSAQHQRQEQSPDEPRFEEVVESAHPSSYPPRFYRDDRGPAYGNPAVAPAQHDTRAVIIPESPRYERGGYHDEFRPVETVRYVRRASPGAQPYPYPPAEVRTYRSVSRAAIDRPYPYHDLRDPPRTVVRPAADRERSRSPVLIEERAPSAMGPPQLPASRVVIDEFGREYIEPPSRQEPVVIRRSFAPRPVYGDREEVYDPSRATSRVIRRSVAPASFHGEPEIIYERPPPARAASVIPGPGRYDEEVVYRTTASPAGYSTAGFSPAGYTATRRVVARPDYPPEYRYYRERDYPSQPPSQPGGEYYEVRDSRPPRGEPQHIVRFTTVRPESPARSEVVRMSSVRPEPALGEYGAPSRSDAQAMPPPRSYSVRPMAPPPPPQHGQYVRHWPEHETRPEYETRPMYGEQVRVEDDGVTYVDSAPREVYR